MLSARVDLGGFGFGAFWVSAALGLFVASLGLGAAGGRRPKQAPRLAAQDAPLDARLRALLDDRLSRVANDLSALILLAILALMVFTPSASGLPERSRSYASAGRA